MIDVFLSGGFFVFFVGSLDVIDDCAVCLLVLLGFLYWKKLCNVFVFCATFVIDFVFYLAGSYGACLATLS